MNHLAANSQSCTCVMYVLVCSLGSISMIGKKPPVARKLSEDGPFELTVLSVTTISLLRFFAGKTEGAERTGCKYWYQPSLNIF